MDVWTTRNVQAFALVTVSASTSTRNVPTSTSTLEIMLTSTSSTRNMRTQWTVPLLNESLRQAYEVCGRRPASRWAVAMLPRVTIVERGTCVICLEAWCQGDMATELPCKHKYHFECVEKWLDIHATCPQCRYEMPLEDEYVLKNVEISVDIDEVDRSDYDSSSDSDDD